MHNKEDQITKRVEEGHVHSKERTRTTKKKAHTILNLVHPITLYLIRQFQIIYDLIAFIFYSAYYFFLLDISSYKFLD